MSGDPDGDVFSPELTGGQSSQACHQATLIVHRNATIAMKGMCRGVDSVGSCCYVFSRT